MTKEIETFKEDQTITEGILFSKNLIKGDIDRSIIVYLEGDLGAGKTTFTKGIMQGLGYQGLVKSPTYNLVEIHETEMLKVFHFDLYRINDAQELEEIGIQEYVNEKGSLCVFEWPENAESILPKPDFTVEIEHINSLQMDLRKLTIKSA